MLPATRNKPGTYSPCASRNLLGARVTRKALGRKGEEEGREGRGVEPGNPWDGEGGVVIRLESYWLVRRREGAGAIRKALGVGGDQDEIDPKGRGRGGGRQGS